MAGKALNITHTLARFNRAIVEATHSVVCAYKLNTAYYEAHGAEGWEALRLTIQHIHYHAPAVPVILDAKRGDVEHSNEQYAFMAFDHLGADAITVQPYLGGASLAPFFKWKDKGIFVLCRTSNPGASELQDLQVFDEPLYKYVARRTLSWNQQHGNCGVVAAATYPQELSEIRQIVDDMPLLIPGIGAQGGDLAATVKAGRNSQGRGMIINASRSIIFASSGPDFADAAKREAENLYNQISQLLKQP